MACCAFGNLEIRTVKPNRFKNQFSNTWKLLGQNWNHQSKFYFKKAIALHHCGLKADFPKHFY